uniref:Si:ch211-286o17.1 n=2 Tax=Gasterosteus aculeatus aculeatus TaxID=481459 RepID=A0AAQ4P5H2_GASAC
MAASSPQKPRGPRPTLALALLLIASLLNAGLAAGDDAQHVVMPTLPTPTVPTTPQGDTGAITSNAAEGDETVAPTDAPLSNTTEEPKAASATATEAAGTRNTEPVTVKDHAKTSAPPLPARGDGPNNIPRLAPQVDVVCVSKEAVKDKNAVNLKLKASSTCKDTKEKIGSVLQELCGDGCKLDIYQEDDSDQIIVSGKYVEEDVAGMADRFNNDNIKDKTDVQEAVPRWGREEEGGKNSKLVLVSLLLTGLLLAALLVAGYYFKTHRRTSKGIRLAESFQVDEENQANTLVSVAPLPQEPHDKPTAIGETPPENGTSAAPATNGHSATQTPVADTEMCSKNP